MLYSFLAGICNAIATIFLKNSNNQILLIFFALIFYGLNFLLFREGLKYLDPKNSYSTLILVTLVSLRLYELFKGNFNLNSLDIFGFMLFVIAIFIFNR